MLTLHLICCGAPLLIFGVVSVASAMSWQRFAAALPYLAVIGGFFAAGALYYYFVHGCRKCPTPGQQNENTGGTQ